MEDRIVAMLTKEGEDTVTGIEWESTLALGNIMVLDKGGYELFQLEQ